MHKYPVLSQLSQRTVDFEQFSLALFQFSYTRPIDRTLSGSTSADRSGLESDGNERVHCISQSSGISEVSLIRLLTVITRTHLGGILPLCRDTVSVFYSPSRLGKLESEWQHISWGLHDSSQNSVTQSVGAVEYPNCFSAEG